MVFVEFGDGGLEREFAAGELELLDEVGGACERHALAIFDEGEADGRSEMALSAAWRPEKQQVGAGFEPAITGAEGEDVRFGEHRHGLEGEAVEGLAGWQPGFEEMALRGGVCSSRRSKVWR